MRRDKVTTICLGKRKEWKKREEAIQFFYANSALSTGEEQKHYYKVLLQLKNGKTICKDE